jgi:hypothetical protein
MKAARVLSIIGLIVGLAIGLLSLFFSLRVLSSFGSDELTYFESLDKNKEVLDKDDADYDDYMAFKADKKIKKMIPASVTGIIFTLIAGVLGFFGHLKIKPLYLSIILLVCSIVLLFSLNFIQAILFIIASILYFIYYRKNKQNKVVTA